MKSIRVITALFLIFALVFTVFWGKNFIIEQKLTTEAESYLGVISMWQIDSFEGGVGSRKQFLLKVARGFEKKNKGVLVMVSNMTKDGAEENFKNGVFPDIISYGNGLNLQNVSEFEVTNTVKGGLVGDKVFATAWCRGGYAIITNPNCQKNSENNKLLISKSEYTQPLISLIVSDEQKTENVEILQPMDAYVKFVSGKIKSFLGTQRDVNRLEARGMQVQVSPLSGYNDLYQYVSITSSDQLKRYYSEKFVNYLVSEQVQKQLNSIGMFSCFYNVEFQNEHLTQMQKMGEFQTISAFTSVQKINEMNRLSLLAMNGDKEAKIKIKNMLI